MQVSTTITLGPADNPTEKLAGNATDLAALILEAVGGDPAADYCSVSISDSGTAGTWEMEPPA